MDVTAKGKVEVNGQKVVKTMTGDYDFGNDHDDAVTKHSKEIIFANYRASGKVTVQALIRRSIEAGKNEEEVKKIVAGYKLGAPSERVAKDPTKDILAQWPDMSEEERQDFLRKLKASG